MNIIKEELFKKVALPVLYIVTTNSTVKNNGALIMGRGAALQARNLIPGIDMECGKVITESGCMQSYGFQEVRAPGRWKAGFGIFQVKTKFDGNAEIGLIVNSCKMLRTWMLQDQVAMQDEIEEGIDSPLVNVRMNFPGIGAGHLKDAFADIEAMLHLYFDEFDNLTVCLR